MITKAFQSMMWVGAVGGSAIGCYMLSLGVASERAGVEKLDRQIVVARREIRALETELGTRGRLAQLERWNRDVLALGAPKAGQYLDNELVLARVVDGRLPTPNAPPEVLMASTDGAAAGTAAPAPKAVVRDDGAPVATEAPAFRTAQYIVPADASPTAPKRAALIDADTARDIGAAARAERASGAPRAR